MAHTENQTGKVLIVDDEARNLAIVEELLEGFEVKTARSGSDALEKLKSFEPDIVLLDIMMPGMDGYEVCRRIRQNKSFQFTKIIFVSGKSMIEERLAGYEAGGDDHIAKPFDHDELLAKLRVFLRLKNVEEVSQVKSDFLRFISTGTMTPLNALLGLSKSISTEPRLARQEVVEYAGRIHSYGQVLLTFMDKALSLCSGETPTGVQPSLQSVKEIVEGAISELEETVARCKVTFNLQLSEEFISCYSGLLGKAFNYVLETILTGAPEGSAVNVRATTDGGSCTIAISRDQRISHTLPEASSNAVDHVGSQVQWQGLSLAIAERIVELNNGSLAVENGQGSAVTVTFRLPVIQVRERAIDSLQ